MVCAPVYDAADVYGDPYFRERELLISYEDEVHGTITAPGVVPKLSATPGRVRQAARWTVGHDTASGSRLQLANSLCVPLLSSSQHWSEMNAGGMTGTGALLIAIWFAGVEKVRSVLRPVGRALSFVDVVEGHHEHGHASAGESKVLGPWREVFVSAREAVRGEAQIKLAVSRRQVPDGHGTECRRRR